MLRRFTVRLTALVLILGVSSGSAWGQVFIQPYGIGAVGSPAFPYQNFYSWGSPYVGAYTWGSPYQGYGWGNSYQGFGGYPAYAAALGNGYPGYLGSYSTSVTVPGWSVSADSITAGTVRSRMTMSPAMGVSADSPLLQVGYEATEPIAQLVVTVPSADTQVWVQGSLTQQRGTVRRFRTPALQAGQEYEYEIIGRWGETCGCEAARTVSRTVTVRAGQVVSVDLTK